jgi:lipopolysaccharide biosynthesis glycosyltransferase
MTKPETVPLVIAADENYLQHAGVMLASLFVHNPELCFKIYLISNVVYKSNYQKVRKLVMEAGHQFERLAIDASRLQHLKLSAHATTAVYYRLLIPELLDKSIEKVLYLDCDLIVKDSLMPLWKMQLMDHPVAAGAEQHFDRHHALGMSADAPYFNSGVMLMNLPVWRRNNIAEHAIEFLRENPDRIEAWDQDALNAVLQGNWLPLHPRWNLQTSHFGEGEVKQEHSAELEECRRRPAVIHYTAKFKPWHSWCSHPLKDEYYQYLSLTPWKNFRLPEHTRWHLLKQRAKKLVNWVARKNLFEVYA